MTLSCDEFRRARPLLGTIVEIMIEGTAAEALAAFDSAFDAIAEVQQLMSFHDPASDLSKVNASAADYPVPIDKKMHHVLQVARSLYDLSSGIFDVTAAPLPNHKSFLSMNRADSASEYGSFADVELLDGRFVRFHRKGIRIDLGGIAKGFAVSEAITALQSFGIRAGSVNAGGDLQVFGPKPHEITVRNPRHPGLPLTSFRIRNCAVATSAHYFANRTNPDTEVGSFVDPRNGTLSSRALSVTIITSNALYADALTKIVMIDPEGSTFLLEYFDAAALVMDQNGAIFCTPSWHASIEASA
jgi:thiamine biosynthesis lipoprotein